MQARDVQVLPDLEPAHGGSRLAAIGAGGISGPLVGSEWPMAGASGDVDVELGLAPVTSYQTGHHISITVD